MKIGIMSFAHHHSEAYIQNLHNIEGIELIGVADEDQPRAKKFANQYETNYYSSYEALLETRPDGILVCSENTKHRPMVEMAAQAGVNVFCEKPLAVTSEDAVAMVHACKQNRVLLMTAFPMRFSAPLISVKARLDAGEFGKIYAFNSSNQGEMPVNHRHWFVEPELSGGGAIMDHTVHLVDIMRWYLESEAKDVYTQSNRVFHADEVGVETGALEMINFHDGVFASIDSSWSRPAYWPTWGGLNFEMVTERGAILVDGFRQNLTLYTEKMQRPQWVYWGSDANQLMINEFIQAIHENRQPKVTGEDGLRAVEVTVAAYQSVQSGQPVEVHLHQV